MALIPSIVSCVYFLCLLTHQFSFINPLPFMTQIRNRRENNSVTAETDKEVSQYLRMNIGPQIIGLPEIFSTVIINCTVQASPPAKISWLKNGQPFSADLATSIRTPTDFVRQSLEETVYANKPEPVEAGGHISAHSELYLPCLDLDDQGVYTCEATSEYGKIQKSVRLDIDGGSNVFSTASAALCSLSRNRPVPIPANIVRWNSHVLTRLGSTVQLPCKSIGYPRPSVVWQKNSRKILTDTRMKLLSDGSLEINRLQWSDMGLYRCVATNEISSDQINTFLYPYKE